MADNTVVSAAIYPPIGVCRVGNSQDEYFYAPEVPNPPAQDVEYYRDKTGALKRQAARFRVYGLNKNGKVVCELTADNADVTWGVHLVNQKAAWYQFQMALDIPEASSAPLSALRNAQVADRSKLVIDAGKATIAGKMQQSAPLAGKFMQLDVYLGELKTDEAGRLVVLGGRGVSASYNGAVAITFGNNDTWHDDTSDGPVTAQVKYQGKTLPVKPAWVITAPPDYAPMQKSVRTMWDLMRDTAIKAGNALVAKAKLDPKGRAARELVAKAGFLLAPAKPSFTHDILPIFQRLTRLQWVNAGFAAAFGHGGAFNLSTPEWIAKLSSLSPAYAEVRKTIANQFRVYSAYDADSQTYVDRYSWSPTPWPWLYGDAMNIPAAQTPRQNASLSDTQLAFLQQWAAGDFIADYEANYVPHDALENVPLELQPDTLTRASMEFCLADAFHPGCEMTWPMRTVGMYAEAFRLKHAEEGSVEPYYGSYCSSDALNALKRGQYPGGITRWMAVPWQTDTGSCRSGYDKAYDPYLPTFWPARVPNQVLMQADYNIVMDTQKPLEERLEAFARRTDWNTPLGLESGYINQINTMIDHFDNMSIVLAHKGIPNDPNFPAEMEVAVPKQILLKGKAGKPKQYIAPEHDVHDWREVEKSQRFQS